MPCERRFAGGPASRVAEIEVPNPHEIHERGETTFGRRAALTTAIYAVVLSIASSAALQIAIVSASVAILSTSRPMFWFSLIPAIFGAALTVNGFVPIFTLPFLHHH